ncbi:MAG: RidA family protein [Solirubrobacterales bacterium]
MNCGNKPMDSFRRTITSSGAPQAVGPYSHAVVAGGLLFCSGQLPVRPHVSDSFSDDIAAQTQQCLENLQAVCEEAGTSLSQATRLTIYTTDLDSFSEINQAYAEYFSHAPPARAAVGVAALPLGASVEIDAIVAAPVSAD